MIQVQSGVHDRRKERREEDESEVNMGYNIEWLTTWRLSSSCNKEEESNHTATHACTCSLISSFTNTWWKLPTTIFTTRQKEPGDEANTNIALLSAMKQQSLMLLVAYAMTDFALWQLVYSWRHEVTVYMTTYIELVPLWISLTCCLQKWKQETQHMFTWSTWYMELVCIN